MLDPAAVSARMSPGDKVTMSVHKAKAEPGAGGSFMHNAQSAGLVPGGPTPPALPSQMSAVSRPAVPGAIDHRALLLAHLRQRLLGR